MNSHEDFILTTVDNKSSKRKFHKLPSKLYKSEKNWIRPINKDIENIFDTSKNKFLHNGEAIRWILCDGSGKVIGRIAAFYEKNSPDENGDYVGGIGFFDCINNKQAAFTLFDAGKKWLKEKGMEAMDGPINIGMRHSFWGCLAKGFHEPVYNMPYNFPYYNELFQAYGFKNYYNQYTYQRSLERFKKSSLHPAILRRGEYILNSSEYEIRKIKKGDMQFAYDFTTIFNKAWGNFHGIKKATDQESCEMLKSMQPILDERLIYYAYYKGEPVGFFVMMPDIYQIIKHLKGRWNLWSKLIFTWHLKITKSVDRVLGRIFGVIPEHQGKGVEAAMVMAFEKEVEKKSFHYKSLENSWVGDFNPVMMKLTEFIGSSIYKTHITYRYLFDRNKEFKRAPLVNTLKKEKNIT